MNTSEARVTPTLLALVQQASYPVPIEQFRLLDDCAICLWLAEQPATAEWNDKVRGHILDEHRELVTVSIE